jgi:hypothetical protein
MTTRYAADQDSLAAAGVEGINFQLSMSSDLLDRLAEAVLSGRLTPPPVTSVKLGEALRTLYGDGTNRPYGKPVIIP